MSNRIQGDGTKIVLTGGHAATTASAVIDEIHAQKLQWKLYFIGAKYAVEGKNVTTLEFRALPEKGVTFLPLVMGRLQRRFTLWTIPSLLKIPVGFFHAFYLLIKIKPKAILSFGGFSSVPVVFSSKILGIPVVIHEQTAAAGRANIVSSSFANQIALSREESKKYFPSEKTIVTGNPVSAKTLLVKEKTHLPKIPTIFITGGSRGSQNLNSGILEILPRLLKRYKVTHQTGEFDIGKFEKIKSSLPSELSKNYEVFAGAQPSKIVDYYDKADLIISRSGANTVSEIFAVRRPAILVPLPISYLDEQTKNAKILEKAGFAKIIPQKELTGEKIENAVIDIFSKYPSYMLKINKFESPDKNAAAKVVELLKKYL